MRVGLAELLATKGVLLADGATGTNYFGMGLDAGRGARALERRPSRAGAGPAPPLRRRGRRHHPHQHVRLQPAPARPPRRRGPGRRARPAAPPSSPARWPRPPSARSSSRGRSGRPASLFEPLGASPRPTRSTPSARRSRRSSPAEPTSRGSRRCRRPRRCGRRRTPRSRSASRTSATCSFDTAGRTMMGMLPGDLTDGVRRPDRAAGRDRRQLRRRRLRHPRVAPGHDRARRGDRVRLEGQLRHPRSSAAPRSTTRARPS